DLTVTGVQTCALPILENAWSSSMDAFMQERIESIIHRIQFDDLKHELHVWAYSGSHDLIKGAILLARYQYPELQEEHIQKQLDRSEERRVGKECRCRM